MIFLLIFIVKLIFFLNCNIFKTPDSVEYIGMDGFDLFRFQLNEYRVPVYPLIIEICERLLGQMGLLMVCMIQLVTSFISAIYLFKTFNLFSKKKYVSLVVTMAYACSMVIMGWDKTILTESFSLSLTVFLIYNLVNYLKYKKIKSVIYLAMITIIGTFMRPTYLLYVCIILGFFIARSLFLKKERVIAIKSSLVSSIPIMIILVYSFLFYQQFEQFSLSNSLLGQQVDVMAQTCLYQYGNDAQIVKTIDEITKMDDFISKPFLARSEVMNSYGKVRISEFVNQIKKDNLIAYSKELVKMIGEEANVDFESYYLTKHRSIAYLFYAYSTFMRYTLTFFQGMVIAAICFLIFINRMMKRKIFDWVYFGLFGFITLTYVTSILGTNAEYQRTAITSLPFIILALYLFVINLIDFIQGLKDEKFIGENYDVR